MTESTCSPSHLLRDAAAVSQCPAASPATSNHTCSRGTAIECHMDRHTTGACVWTQYMSEFSDHRHLTSCKEYDCASLILLLINNNDFIGPVQINNVVTSVHARKNSLSNCTVSIDHIQAGPCPCSKKLTVCAILCKLVICKQS